MFYPDVFFLWGIVPYRTWSSQTQTDRLARGPKRAGSSAWLQACTTMSWLLDPGWGLNLGAHASTVSTWPLEPSSQLLVFRLWKQGLTWPSLSMAVGKAGLDCDSWPWAHACRVGLDYTSKCCHEQLTQNCRTLDLCTSCFAVLEMDSH